MSCTKWMVPALMLPVAVAIASPETFVNPVADRGADPFLTKFENRYYYTYTSGGGGLRVHEGNTPLEAIQSKGRVVWRPKDRGQWTEALWAPELHQWDDWYIYVAACDGDNANHRMVALRSRTGPAGDYEFVDKVTTPEDRWAIDGTVFVHEMDDVEKRYFVWSGWPGDVDGRQDIYIGEMSDPVTITGPKVMISTPEYHWEKTVSPQVNEGPQVLRHGGKTFLIYSANGSWTDDYCMAQLTLTGDDPMDPDSWSKHSAPVFGGIAGVKGPGHGSFVTTGDGTDWIVFHAARNPGSGWDRVIHLQPFSWDVNGNPAFRYPIPRGVELPIPTDFRKY